ncbi:MAG: efflux RND transporter periplasmic adaptor subunit [Steroidobacteraceae bacterium]
MNAVPRKLAGIVFGAVLLAALSAGAGYWLARRGSDGVLRTQFDGRLGSRQSSQSVSATSAAADRERKPLYWYDPMVPNQQFDKPGKSPFMDMQLIPKYADDSGEGDTAGAVSIDPGIVQNLGARFTQVERGSLSQPVEAVGTLEFNQRDVAVIQARSAGFVTRVHARAPGDVIGRNAAIVDLLVPEWAGAQAEFLAVLRSGERDLMEAARQRLLLLGMPPDLVADIETTGEPRTTTTVRSPLAGVVETLDAREGMTVSAGSTLAKINGLGSVWLEAAIPEARGALVQFGKAVEVRLTAYPGQAFKGRVIAVLPQANVETRTVRVRIELPNSDGRLRPGMFAQVRLDSGGQAPALYVSSEAIIRTGTRAVVILAGERGRFIPTEVQVGADVNGKTVILGGLQEGQRVVASGQFLIDSEASLKGVLARLANESMDGGEAQSDEAPSRHEDPR